ncbi:hypothetical protein BGZ65_008722, partial [Modicella reniformis]
RARIVISVLSQPEDDAENGQNPLSTRLSELEVSKKGRDEDDESEQGPLSPNLYQFDSVKLTRVFEKRFTCPRSNPLLRLKLWVLRVLFPNTLDVAVLGRSIQRDSI